MTKKEIIDTLEVIIEESRYKNANEREAICEAIEVISVCDEAFIKAMINE